MGITDIAAFSHLSSADIENLADELDEIRLGVERTRGERDSRYIHRVIAAQRAAETAGRVLLSCGTHRTSWLAGAAALSLAKIVENMEIGHNVMHGQWDWMNDPEIHSSTWEWDMCGVSRHWRTTHNFMHHKYTNVLGMDHDLGFGVLRITRDQNWMPLNLGNLLYNAVLALGFEWGIGLQPLELEKFFRGQTDRKVVFARIHEFLAKAGQQLFKDYVAFPLVTMLSPGATYKSTLTANITANVIRNLWSNAVIFCGHFPDGAEKFTSATVCNESRGQWYLRQMLGSANFRAGSVMRLMSGNLCHQIEHHLFPDLPSNRLRDISVQVKSICDKYDLPYTTGPLTVQYLKTWRTIAKLSLPDRCLRHAADNAPETRSERMFLALSPSHAPALFGGRRHGLKTAITAIGQQQRHADRKLPQGSGDAY
ncbi:fatty acid desaturase family protein [Mycobacteroides abscessus]|uniref:fatty acid desaturase family protein n=1 Tax=Mycobacteroides abscessus TaxID=36809 RepID=UPI000C25B790|nr:fatty acid desaturase [Mycobacteroides abscessus]